MLAMRERENKNNFMVFGPNNQKLPLIRMERTMGGTGFGEKEG